MFGADGNKAGDIYELMDVTFYWQPVKMGCDGICRHTGPT